MGLKDLFITPLFIMLLSVLAYIVRPYVTNTATHKYFLPALWIRFFGAIMLGLVYQFYYGGGDTFNYFTHGSRWIWEAFLDDPSSGFKLLWTSGGTYLSETFEYSQHIWYYRDQSSYFIVRLTAFFDLFTFHTYTATALFFASFSFSGLWALFSAVQKKYQVSTRWLATCILFFPSVVFWGSGILKDPITLGALGWLTFALIHIIEFQERHWYHWLLLIISTWLILSIKVYIAICYIPVVFIWLFWKQIISIRNWFLRSAIAPVLLLSFGAIGYMAMVKIGDTHQKYALDNIAERAAITAHDIRYGWGARTGGDGGYDLGELDGSWQSMIRLMPQAITVSLFRPYLWEVKNPLMLLTAGESLAVLIMTIYMIIKGKLGKLLNDPFLVFCLVFSLLFAFAVGVSTFNFGTLMRYKIPLMPFYMIVIVKLYSKQTQS